MTTATRRLASTTAVYVAAEVRAEVARQRIQQRKLAEALGLSQAQMSERLRGGVEIRLSELETIADLLGLPITRFLPTPDRAA